MLIRKLFKAEMAHNVPGAYTSRCHYLHGHSYKFELFIRSSRPNSSAMVADFKAVKEMGINDFFDSFDHSVIVWDQDPLAALVPRMNPKRHVIVPFIPTAEMLAKALFYGAKAILESGPKLSGEKDALVDHVIVHETDTGYGCFGQSDMTDDAFPSVDLHRWTFSEGIRESWKKKDWLDLTAGAAILH